VVQSRVVVGTSRNCSSRQNFACFSSTRPFSC
jgi:hypothetical protein